MIRLVVTDLDGTFWLPDLTVPPEQLAAVSALAERDVAFMVATSRRRRVVAEYLGRVGLAPAAVVLDGAMGVDQRDGSRFYESAFSVDAARDALAIFRSAGIEPCAYVDEGNVGVVLPPVSSTSPAYLAYIAPVARAGDLDAVVARRGVFGFSVMGRSHAEVVALVDALTAFGAELMLLHEERYDGWSLIVAPPGVTKWNGVIAYADYRGIASDEILAVGDGDNDVDLLTRAGVAVAIRGGAQRALAVADHVVDGPTSNGWSSIIDLACR